MPLSKSLLATEGVEDKTSGIDSTDDASSSDSHSETHSYDSSFEEEFDYSRKPRRRVGAAMPYVRNANELLFGDESGLSAILPAMDFSNYLCISKSGVADKAGHGLFIVAKDKDLDLKAEQLITWYNGKVVFYDQFSQEQIAFRCYTIGLGSTKKNAAQVILSNPHDYNLAGCAHFANHSENPNVVLKYIRGRLGIVGVALVLQKDVFIRKGHALEVVFDYGLSSKMVHNIPEGSAYRPKPIAIDELQNIMAPEEMKTVPPIKRRAIMEEEHASAMVKRPRFFSEHSKEAGDSKKLDLTSTMTTVGWTV